jgi:hypothetical protein
MYSQDHGGLFMYFSFRHLFSTVLAEHHFVLKIPPADAYGGRNQDFGGHTSGKGKQRLSGSATGSVYIFGRGDLNIHFKSILSTVKPFVHYCNDVLQIDRYAMHGDGRFNPFIDS